MAETTIIDNVFVAGQINWKKHTARQILGTENVVQSGHERFYSKRFIPFVYERDVKGKIIKPQPQIIQTQKQMNLMKVVGGDKGFSINSKNSKTDLSIGSKFNFHEISHFRNVRIQSHMEKLPLLRKELQELQVRNTLQKMRMEYEAFQLTNLRKSTIEDDASEQNRLKQKKIMKNQGHSVKNLKSHMILSELNKKGQVNDKIKRSRSNSMKNLANTNRHGNPQLQQMQRQVKVHFNHPELQRLKQSKKLTFKFLQNIQKGDKMFKQKVQEYRTIKQRIKKQMNKV